MQYYMAPLEGITGYVYRNAYHRFFTPFDKYFTPFVAPTRKASLSSKEKNDILPDHNKGLNVVPQILSNNATLFIMCAKKLYLESGYSEVNLNLGCPSGTVISKGKGAGFLGRPDELDRFLDEIYKEKDMPAISIKTRLGMEDTEEFSRILDIYNQYPLAELIIHPRLQKDLYRGAVHLDSFGMAVERAKAALCYNGDIMTRENCTNICNSFPTVDRIMLGRGILCNPFLLEKLKSGDSEKGINSKSINRDTKVNESKEKCNRFRAYHDAILEGYVEIMPGEMPVLFKMKELWIYMAESFDFGSDKDRIEKKIRKVNNLREYHNVMDVVFDYQLKSINNKGTI